MRAIRWIRAAAVVLAFVTACFSGAAGLRAETSGPPSLVLGTAWYPEQWPESRWEADLTLMQKAGIHMVRVGEFAWSRMEPTEGQYDLDWLEGRAIAAAASTESTPWSGTPTRRATGVADTKVSGDVAHRRERPAGTSTATAQQFNWANPKYRELARDNGRADGQALRPQSLRARLADRQRVCETFRSTPEHARSSRRG